MMLYSGSNLGSVLVPLFSRKTIVSLIVTMLIAMMLFNNSSFKVRLLEKRAMRQMEKAEKAGGKKEGA